MQRLSVCLIVKNEAKRLLGCLESLGDLAAEVIVCDTGSTDGTGAIAARYGAQVHSIPWADDFAAARNQSLDRATGEWILVIDADETLTASGQQLVRQILTENPAELLLLTWLRRELGTRQSPYTQVARLFRHHPQLRFTRPYHETIDESAEAVATATPRWKIASSSVVAMDHTGYTADAVQARNKVERSRQILEKALSDRPDDAYLSNKLGALYGEQGNWQQSLVWLERGLSSRPDPMTRYELHYHLGLAYRHLNRPQQAQTHYQQALSVPINARLKLGAGLNLGSLYKQQGRFDAALALFEQAVAAAPEQAVAHYNLGVVRRAMGNLHGAIAAYRRAIELAPDYAEAHQNLGAALLKLGQSAASQQAFQTAIDLHEQTNSAAAVRLRHQLIQLGLS